MAKVPYIDDLFLMGEAQGDKDYEKLHNEILDRKNAMTDYVEFEEEIFGFLIHDNQVLSKLCDMPVKVIRFMFSGVETLHKPEQLVAMEQLFGKLFIRMQEEKVYYQLRLPGHVVDAVKALKMITDRGIFCGGTTYYQSGQYEKVLMEKDAMEKPDGLVIDFATQGEINACKDALKTMATLSFKEYQGQYHISPVTERYAADIYRNWIEAELNGNSDKKILLAKMKGEIAGFCLLNEEERGMDMELVTVSSDFRGMGVYKNMIAYLLRYAGECNKYFYSSTQIDNYASQHTWASRGMKPFYTIYNYHYDMR